MNIILLSGGSGKRLWPLSNAVRSKQFIKIFDGGRESMLQRVFRQIREEDPEALVIAAAPAEQISAIREQLGEEIGISVEPERKNTFPAIALAAAYLHEKKGLALPEPVIVCPVDPYVEEGYFKALQEMCKKARDGKESLVLMGITPTYPSAKYGYILPGQDNDGSRYTFIEKPDEKTAADYIAKGALWNGGVFACRLSYVLEKSREFLGTASYEELLAGYADLPEISFDYAVAEKERSIEVVPYAGPWMDLGTWNTFTEAMEKNAVGDVRMDETCRNVHVINELGIPVLVLGGKDLVVAAGPEGILVADKAQSSYMKPYVEEITGKSEAAVRTDISVIVPLYRGNQYIPGLLDMMRANALAGRDLCMELILVQDDPEAPRPSLPSSELPFSLTLCRHEENKGIQRSRLDGLALAKGTYVLFLDQDDEIAPDALSVLFRTADGGDAAVSAWTLEEKTEEGIVSHKIKYASDASFLDALLTGENVIGPPGHCLIKKETVRKCWEGCTLTQDGADDYLLWLNFLLGGGHFAVCGEALYTHRYNPEAYSLQSEKMILSKREALGLAEKKYPFTEREGAFIKRFLAYQVRLEELTNLHASPMRKRLCHLRHLPLYLYKKRLNRKLYADHV